MSTDGTALQLSVTFTKELVTGSHPTPEMEKASQTPKPYCGPIHINPVLEEVVPIPQTPVGTQIQFEDVPCYRKLQIDSNGSASVFLPPGKYEVSAPTNSMTHGIGKGQLVVADTTGDHPKPKKGPLAHIPLERQDTPVLGRITHVNIHFAKCDRPAKKSL
mmetsp:Transcript_34118/g.58350  ORF Transcript_34118/g.58350 Transcript_34118/m.58350 type:complete len:161 (-) Transcript_34118:69-551(-)